MDLIRYLREQHEILLTHLNRLRREMRLPDAETRTMKIREEIFWISELAAKHADIEEKYFVPAFRESFEKSMGPANAVLAYEHQDIREVEKAVSGLQCDIAPAKIFALAAYFIEKLSAHIEKEESVIFPLAKEMDLVLRWEDPRPGELRTTAAYEI